MNFSKLLEKLSGRTAQLDSVGEKTLVAPGVALWSLLLPEGALSAPEDWFAACAWEGPRPSTDLAWRQSMPPEDSERLYRAREAVYRNRSGSYEMLCRVRTGEGNNWLHVLERGRVTDRHSDGAPRRVEGVWIDLTAQVEAEARQLWPFQVFEESAEMLALLDMQCTIISANRALRDRCGVRIVPGVTRPHLGDLLVEESARKVMHEGVGQVLAYGLWRGEGVLKDSSGGTFFASQRLRLHRNEKGEPLFISLVALDVTDERVAAQDRMSAVRREYQERKLDSLGLLAGGLAHEFNNLLTAVLGTSSLARNDLRDAPGAQSYFRQIEEVSFRAAEHCQVLHAFAGRSQVRVQPFDLNDVLDEWLLDHRNWIGNRARVAFTPSPQACVASLDRDMIRSCLRKLVENAIEASQKTDALILLRTGSDKAFASDEFSVSLPLNSPVGDVRWLEVMDQGSGMSAEALDRFCDPFFTTKPGHAGLGLATVLGAVRSHGGVVMARSGTGSGTTVRLVLPCGVPVRSVPPVAQPSQGIWRGAGQILLVDDQVTVRNVTTKLLENLGFTPLVAADGAEGVRVFREHAESLKAVLLDMTMPGMDGAATYREIRRIDAEVPVILMSGFSETEMIENFKDFDLAGVLRKPFTLEKLSSTLKQVLS